MRFVLITTVLALGLAAAASGVIIDSGDGTGNTTAPVPDPGWSNVGPIAGTTGVYLGGRFALTAHHVGPGNIALGGVTYAYVPGTAVQLNNGDGTRADLLMFEIYPTPPLPAPRQGSSAPASPPAPSRTALSTPTRRNGRDVAAGTAARAPGTAR